MNITINGVILEGNFMDADFMEPFEAATKNLGKRAEACRSKKYENYAESMREQCAAVDDYFDEIFGGGTAETVFKGKEHNLMVHLKAVEELTNWANGEKKKLNDFTNKYIQRQYAAAKRQQAESFLAGKKHA